MFTKHDTINEMLVATGSRPLPEAQSNHPLYVKAELILDRVTKGVHSLGLWYNTVTREVEPNDVDNPGRINLADMEVLTVDATDRTRNLAIRNGFLSDQSKLYLDGVDQYDFTGESVEVELRFDIPFHQVQTVIKDYIRASAVYEFYLNEDGGDPKLSYYKRNRDEKFSLVKREDTRNRQINIYDNPTNAINKLRRGGRPSYGAGQGRLGVDRTGTTGGGGTGGGGGPSGGLSRADIQAMIDASVGALRTAMEASIAAVTDAISTLTRRVNTVSGIANDARDTANRFESRVTALENAPEPPAPTAIGVGQSWGEYTNSRIPGETYTNDTDTPIMVLLDNMRTNRSNDRAYACVRASSSSEWLALATVGPNTTGYAETSTSFIVPVGNQYSLQTERGEQARFKRWFELR